MTTAARKPLLREVATERLRDAIVAGDLAPGEVVKDAQLAQRLGMTVAPVRDALARLADEGLVESKPQSHTRVTPLVLRTVRDALAVLQVVHELVAREAADLVTEADLEAMREANTRFRSAAAAGDVEAAVAADDALHGVLVDRCGNRAARATIARWTPLVRRIERRRFTPTHGAESADRHDELIATCAAHDPDAAAAITRTIWASI